MENAIERLLRREEVERIVGLRHSVGWTPQLGQRRGQVKRDSRWKV